MDRTNLYFRIYLCYCTNERLKFHGRHGLSSREQREFGGTIVERFRERGREFAKRA